MKKLNAILLNAALRYAEIGYPVAPCVPGGKIPITAHGIKDSTTDIAQIEAWWAKHPEANIGISAAGLIVIDVDGADNHWPCDPDMAHELSRAPMAFTPNGGRHYIFKQIIGKAWKNTVGVIAPDVDTRADGGYFIASPSIVNGKQYRWAETMELDVPPDELPEPPDWLVLKLDTPGASAVPLPDGNVIPSGQRNSTLARIAGSLRRIGMTRDEIFAALERTNQDRCKPPLSMREVERIAKSISRYEPDGVAVAVIEDHYGQDQDAASAGAKSTSEHDEAGTSAPFGTSAPIAEWLYTEPPPMDYLFENLLIKGITGGIFAAGGTGKTYLILCLMLSASLGLPFFRTFRPTRSMRVLGLLGEDPPDMIHRRVKSILGGFDNVDKALLAENLRLYCGRPAPLMRLDGNNPASTAAFKWLKAEVEAFRPELIVLDPKSMFYGLDENSNDNCTQWVNALKELTMNGATVLFCHHVTKASSGALELNGARGGSALADGSRFAANMRGLTEDDAKKYDIEEPWKYVEFRVTKNSYVPKLPGSIFFRFTHDGALEEVDLQANCESTMIDELLCSLQAEASEGNFYTARELSRSKTILPDVTRKDRAHIVKLAIDSGRLATDTQRAGKTSKTILLMPNDESSANDGQNGMDNDNV